MCNIDETGAPSMMFHSFPFVNEYDPRSGDYGLGFFGHSMEVGAYFVRHPHLGTLCYLCDLSNIAAAGRNVAVVYPRDSYR